MPDEEDGTEAGLKEQVAPPTVFLSYSHDSTDHKIWVAGLARDLRKNGVDAWLDQWLLKPGADITSFMERGIRNAARVLMVCTPAYATKADAGRGGVGYEKMIVTGELYRDLGTEKFIPVIAAGADSDALPNFMATRRYVDFRHESSYQSSLEEVLRCIHDAPAEPPPPIGRNPFVSTPSRTQKEEGLTTEQATKEKKKGGRLPAVLRAKHPSPDQVYANCERIIRSVDMFAWRKLYKRLIGPHYERMLQWQDKWLANPPDDDEGLYRAADELLDASAALMVMALCGVESGVPEFSDQRSALDHFLHIPEWRTSGRTVIIEMPSALAYLYNYLHGAVCLSTRQLRQALAMATHSVESYELGKHTELWRHPEYVGWPRGLDGDSLTAWNYLRNIAARAPWIASFFAHEGEILAALGAYSMVLGVVELSDFLAKPGAAERLTDEQSISLDIPPLYGSLKREVREAAFRMAFPGSDAVETICAVGGSPPALVREYWVAWCKLSARFIPHKRGTFFFGGLHHMGVSDLP